MGRVGNGVLGRVLRWGLHGAGANGFLRLAGWGGLGLLPLRVGCGVGMSTPTSHDSPLSSRPPASNAARANPAAASSRRKERREPTPKVLKPPSVLCCRQSRTSASAMRGYELVKSDDAGGAPGPDLESDAGANSKAAPSPPPPPALAICTPLRFRAPRPSSFFFSPHPPQPPCREQGRHACPLDLGARS
jgi:hypothetical protein